MIYLDSAATSLVKPLSVGREMLRAMRSCASPGRGGHEPAMCAAETVYRCRETAARLFNVPDPERVVLTMNATHGLNLAIRSLVKPGTRVLISGYEHNSVTRPLHLLGAEILVAESPLFDQDAALEAFRARLADAELVVCTHVSNVFGFILPVYELAGLCREYTVPLIVDASQSAGILDVDFTRLGAAFVAMPGHKGLLGPQGTGLLLCGREGEPLLAGGSGSDSREQTMPDWLPDRLEAGTHNVPGAAGLTAGMQYVLERGTSSIAAHEQTLLAELTERLSALDGVEVFAGPTGTQSGVLSFRLRDFDCEEAAQLLTSHGVCVRSGLHCAPLAHRSAGTLETGTIRASLSPFTSAAELSRFVGILGELLRRIR
ncbi:MAG: aminotransferase class V-fold PLP-dependent enzyme [Oscillospiraceae bacterium]|nr:aminotransferase class V-fold PLP-dependent enzyme [Oscillospiraceae bacterium]